MRKLTTIVVFFCVFQLSYGQETIPISGGEAAGNGGSASYTVGQ